LPIFPQLGFDPSLRRLVAQLQAQVSVNAIGSLDVGPPTLAFDGYMYTASAVADTCLADLTNSTFQTGMTGTARGLVVSQTIEVQRTPGTTDRDRPITAHAFHHLAFPSRP
jgi:hypothetical protein